MCRGGDPSVFMTVEMTINCTRGSTEEDDEERPRERPWNSPAEPCRPPRTGDQSINQITLLVTSGRGFYNPPNTTMDIVAMSVRRPALIAKENGFTFHERELEYIDSHFRISQEH